LIYCLLNIGASNTCIGQGIKLSHVRFSQLAPKPLHVMATKKVAISDLHKLKYINILSATTVADKTLCSLASALCTSARSNRKHRCQRN